MRPEVAAPAPLRPRAQRDQPAAPARRRSPPYRGTLLPRPNILSTRSHSMPIRRPDYRASRCIQRAAASPGPRFSLPASAPPASLRLSFHSARTRHLPPLPPPCKRSRRGLDTGNRQRRRPHCRLRHPRLQREPLTSGGFAAPRHHRALDTICNTCVSADSPPAAIADLINAAKADRELFGERAASGLGRVPFGYRAEHRFHSASAFDRPDRSPRSRQSLSNARMAPSSLARAGACGELVVRVNAHRKRPACRD